MVLLAVNTLKTDVRAFYSYLDFIVWDLGLHIVGIVGAVTEGCTRLHEVGWLTAK